MESFLDRDDIVVFPYIAPLVINSFAPSTFEMEDKELLDLSLKSEKGIIEYMGRQKIKAQTQKLLFFLNDLFILISKKIEAIRVDYNNELIILENSRQIDLTTFVSNQKKKCTNSFISSVQKIKSSTIDSFYVKADEATNQIIGIILSKATLDDLSNYINNDIISDCELLAQDILNSQKSILCKPQNLFFKSLKLFQKDFENHFKDFSILKVTFNTTSKVPTPQAVNTANLSVVKNYVSEQLSSENKAFGVGAFGGAALGTAICPGIGTAIGFLAGMFAGSQMAPDTETVKKGLVEKIRTPLISYFNSIAGDLERTFNDYIKTLENQIVIEINRYETQYKKDVEKKIKEQLMKKAEVQKRINALDSDCQEIEIRRKKLNDISNKIISLKNDI